MLNSTYFKCLALIGAAYCLHRSDLCAQEKASTVTDTIKQLSAVIIQGKKQLIKQEADRLIYHMQADPQSKTSSVLEMMRKVPLLSLDAEDNVLMKGNSDYKILINGKPSGMMDGNPKQILRSIPASTIDRIEVITTPPAKYESEGLAGIINIVTIKKMIDGYRGSVNLNGQFPEGGPGVGSSVTLKSGKLGVSAFGGASLSYSPEVSTLNRRTTSGANPTDLLQNGTKRSEGSNAYLGLEMSYEIDTLNLVSAQFNSSKTTTEGQTGFFSVLHAEQEMIQRYQSDNDHRNKGTSMDVTINYQRSAKKEKERTLTFSYRYKNNNNHLLSSLELINQLNHTDPDYRQTNNKDAGEQTFQLDYVRPSKNGSLEMGLKSIFRNNQSLFEFDSLDASGSHFIKDHSKSDHFTNDQNVYAAYGSYKYNSKNWGFQSGLRAELTTIDADYIAGSIQVHRTYLNINPTFSLLLKLNKISNLTVGYTSRIKRPNIYRLNPFVDRSNINYESSGNPYLKPVQQNSIQIGYGRYKKSTVNIGLEYAFFRDIDLSVLSFDPITHITRSTYENIGKGSSLSMYFNFRYPFTKNWDASVNGNITYMWISGKSKDNLLKMERLMHGISLTSGYHFGRSWRVNGSLNINGRNPQSFQEISNAMVSTVWSISKSLVNNKLTISATAKNPFIKYRTNQILGSGPLFSQTAEIRNYFNAYGFSINYNFGQLKDALKKNRRGINNDDTSKGNNGL